MKEYLLQMYVNRIELAPNDFYLKIIVIGIASVILLQIKIFQTHQNEIVFFTRNLLGKVLYELRLKSNLNYLEKYSVENLVIIS